MKKIILHIGTYKTGSSSIQNYLYENTENEDFHYIKTGLTHSEPYIGIRHYHLWRSIHSQELLSAIKEEVIASEKDINIISYEGLFRLNKDEISLLKSTFSDFDTSIIFYIRRQDSFIHSLYLEYIKNHRLHQPFSDFIHSKNFKPYCNYLNIIERWEAIFNEKVSVKSYDHEKLAHGDITLSFFNSIKVKKNNNNKIKIENSSLDLASANIMYNFNKSNFDIPKTPFFNRVLSREISETIETKNKPKLFSIDTAAKYLAEYYNENKRIQAQYCPEFNPDLFELDIWPETEDTLKTNSEVTLLLNCLERIKNAPPQKKTNTIEKLLGEKGKAADILRELAFTFESLGKKNTALVIMKYARSIRPNGPVISSKILEIENELLLPKNN